MTLSKTRIYKLRGKSYNNFILDGEYLTVLAFIDF